MDRTAAPSEDEQAESYTAILQAVGTGTARSSFARSMSAATSRCLICRFRAKTIRSSASAASASGSTVPKSCARNFARSSAPPRCGKAARHVPDDRHRAGTARREGDARRGSHRARRADRFPAASWWKCRPSRSWRTPSLPRPTSSPSARTTSRNTRSRWIAVTRSSRRRSTP